MNVYLVYGVFALWWTAVLAFNIRIENPVSLTPPDQRNIQFGFSLSHFRTDDHTTHLLVGAPMTKNSKINYNITGGLYSCGLDNSIPYCRQVNIDQPDKYKPYIFEDHKDGERLGYSIASDGFSSIVVCAPRWHIFQDSVKRNEDFPYGICFHSDGLDSEFLPFSPSMLSEKSGRASYINDAACQFGMSVTYINDHDTYAMGSPGCWTWQGDTWEIALESAEDISQHNRIQKLNLGDVGLTQQGGSGYTTVADLYLGYSVSSMIFGGKRAIVSSMPRTISTVDLSVAEDEKNQTLGPFVYIFEHDEDDSAKLRVLHKIDPNSKNSQDDQLSSSEYNKFTFFGYSLATLDLNGDGMHDLVIGAPFYHNSSHHDQGAIFVYTQQTIQTQGGDPIYEMKLRPEMHRIGRESFGRFGSCVAAIGDIDMDGFEDLAVGAPYQPGGGAVYIYSGSPNGIELTQTIHASELTVNLPGGLSTFGAALSTRLPAHTEGSVQLAVGAYGSDAVLLFSTKEVVNFTWNLEFNGQMDLGKPECLSKLDGTYHSCVRSTVCFLYRTRNTQGTAATNLEFSILLKADTPNKRRLFFESTLNDTLEIRKILGKESILYCERDIQINAKKELKDVVKPFLFRGEARFINTDSSVMLDPHVSLIKTDEKLDIKVECAGGGVEECIADITLQYNIEQSYTLGEESPIKISFTISNDGEPAYNTVLQLNTMGYLKVEANTQGNVTCGEMDKSGKTNCDIDTIFKTNAKTTFTLSFIPETKFFNEIQKHDSLFSILASVTTTSELADKDKAKTQIQVPIKVEGTLDLSSKGSNPAKVNYNSSSFYKQPKEGLNEEQLGPYIKHKYNIYNSNKFSIYSTSIKIYWPAKMKGRYLMYLLDEPSFNGIFASCDIEGPSVNPYNIHSVRTPIQNDIPGLEPNYRQVRMGASRSSDLKVKGVEYTVFTCTFGELEKQQDINIIIHARLVLNTIKEIGQEIGQASSFGQIKVLEMPLNVQLPPESRQIIINTDIGYAIESPVGKIATWIYVVSILGGLLVLAIIVIILWKCGFFERKTPQEMEKGDEGVPLNEGGGDGEGEGGIDQEEVRTPDEAIQRNTSLANDEFRYSQN